MAQATDVDRLNRELLQEKVTYQKHRASLATAFKEAKAPKDLDARLVSFAQEFGADATVLMLKRQPAIFELPEKLDKTTVKAAAPLVEALHESNSSMERLVYQRENILAGKDPSHKRVYINHGREFTFDMKEKQVRYLDGETEPLELTKADDSKAKVIRKVKEKERNRSKSQDQEQGE